LDDLPLFEQKDLVSALDAEEIPSKRNKQRMLSPLSYNKLSVLGYQATQLILNSSDPLSTLVDLTNNFPKHMISMARRINVTDELVEESMANEARIAPGANIMWINGGVLQENDANPFG
jgi:UDP-glucose:glycoprotein glucosyltransferase